MSEEKLLQCYNKGCGMKFDPANNDKESCIYHPGQPVFHDAEKVWSCCNKRSKDFTVFLSTPGCTQAPHNPVKPAGPPKYVGVHDESPKQRQPVTKKKERPGFDSEMVLLKPTVTPSLTQVLAKESENTTSKDDSPLDPKFGIKIGEACKRNGCKASYEGLSSSLELCKYHPGGPVFHEGLKFWSCCKRKTTDFTEFLSQAGCTTDQHIWTIDMTTSRKTVCRYDWHQTGSHVYVTVYAKAAVPYHTSISVNPVRLTASIKHAKDLCFDLDIELAGIVDPEQCTASLAATKVEIKLKKGEASTWAKLALPRTADDDEASSANQQNGIDVTAQEQEDANLALDVDAVDLSDL